MPPTPTRRHFGQQDILPFTDDTQALFDQASWQYALANPGSMSGLGWDWASGMGGSASNGLGLGLGIPELGAIDTFVFGGQAGIGDVGLWGAPSSEASSSPPQLMVTQADTPEALLAPGSEARVRSGAGRGKAPEGWGYWEGLVDAIVNHQGIGSSSSSNTNTGAPST